MSTRRSQTAQNEVILPEIKEEYEDEEDEMELDQLSLLQPSILDEDDEEEYVADSGGEEAEVRTKRRQIKKKKSFVRDEVEGEEDAPNLEKNRKRSTFTLQQKLEVLKYLNEEGRSINATARYFKVDPKSIRLWKSQKAKIEKAVQEELVTLQGEGDIDGLTSRKRIPGGGRRTRKGIKDGGEGQEDNDNSSPSKRPRRTITLADKVQIIQMIDGGQSQSDVARILGISQSTIQTIWSSKTDILERSNVPKKLWKNVQWKKFSTIDENLYGWYTKCREKGMVINTKMLLDKGIEYAEYYKQSEFKSQSERWIKKFKKRHGIAEEQQQASAPPIPPAPSSSGNNMTMGQGMHVIPSVDPQSLHHHQHLLPPSSSYYPNHGHASNSDFLADLATFPPGFLPGLPTTMMNHPNHSFAQPRHSALTPSAPSSQISSSTPSFNSHLPLVPGSGGPVTTCDAMKYIALIRAWITASFGETEEMLNNHVNAVENAILKKRMNEMLHQS